MGSGCDAVGRAVASGTRDPQFKSQQWQINLSVNLLIALCRNDKNKEKEAV